jgi:hypothetical protein
MFITHNYHNCKLVMNGTPADTTFCAQNQMFNILKCSFLPEYTADVWYALGWPVGRCNVACEVCIGPARWQL